MGADSQMQRRILKFALSASALNLLFLLPALLYLFIYDNQLPPARHQVVLFVVLGVWVAIVALLARVFILPRR